MPRRPRQSRGVVPIGEPARVAIGSALIDTSLLVSALTETQPGHRLARDLLDALAEAGTTLVVSPLMDLELPQALANIAGREAGRDRRAGLADGRVRRRSATMTRAAVGRWQRYLETIRWVRAPLEPAIEAAPAIMFTTGLRSYDAAMAATAIAHRCDAIATFDVDFGRLHEVDVPLLLTDARRAGRMRVLRGAARPI